MFCENIRISNLHHKYLFV